jgi:hypothetical protein
MPVCNLFPATENFSKKIFLQFGLRNAELKILIPNLK